MNGEWRDFRESDFLNQCRREKTPVTVITTNGYQEHGVISEFSNRTILLNVNGRNQLFYKSALSTIKPTGDAPRQHFTDAPWGGGTP